MTNTQSSSISNTLAFIHISGEEKIPGKICSLTAAISHIHSLTKKIFKFVVINVHDVGSILSILKGRQNECKGQRMSNNNIIGHINSPFLTPLDVLVLKRVSSLEKTLAGRLMG